MNSDYLFLFPVIFLVMFVYLAILVAVTRKRAAGKRRSQLIAAKRETSSRIEQLSDPKRLGVEGH